MRACAEEAGEWRSVEREEATSEEWRCATRERAAATEAAEEAAKARGKEAAGKWIVS